MARDVTDLNTWPSAVSMGLNVIQRLALHTALTQQVALIQGPPGTGKTYVGRDIITALLDNSHVWRDDGCPVVVICMTNMALDQFLEGVLKTTDKIIRFGNQCTSPLLAPYTLSSRKEQTLQDIRSKKKKTFSDYEDCVMRMNSARRQVTTFRDKLRSNLNGSWIQQYSEAVGKYNRIKSEAECALCRTAKVIGLTSTGAAARRSMLQLLRPKIGWLQFIV